MELNEVSVKCGLVTVAVHLVISEATLSFFMSGVQLKPPLMIILFIFEPLHNTKMELNTRVTGKMQDHQKELVRNVMSLCVFTEHVTR